jgi:UrcA family protein
MRKIIVLALAALSLAGVSTPAAAETMSVAVQYSDLDLSSPAGLAALERRIEAAAKRICVPIPVRSSLSNPTRSSCVRQAMASVQAQVARIVDNNRMLALSGGGQLRD